MTVKVWLVKVPRSSVPPSLITRERTFSPFAVVLTVRPLSMTTRSVSTGTFGFTDRVPDGSVVQVTGSFHGPDWYE